MDIQLKSSNNINLCNNIANEMVRIIYNTKYLIQELKDTKNFYNINYKFNTSLESRYKNIEDNKKYNISLFLYMKNFKNKCLDYKVFSMDSSYLGDYGFSNYISMMVLNKLIVNDDFIFMSTYEGYTTNHSDMRNKYDITGNKTEMIMEDENTSIISSYLIDKEKIGKIYNNYPVCNKLTFMNQLRENIINYSVRVYLKEYNDIKNDNYDDSQKLAEILGNLREINSKFDIIKSDIYTYYKDDYKIRKILEKKQ